MPGQLQDGPSILLVRPTGYLIPLGPATWGITPMEKSFPGTGLTTQTARKETAPPPLQSQVWGRAGDLDGEAAAELLSWHQGKKLGLAVLVTASPTTGEAEAGGFSAWST